MKYLLALVFALFIFPLITPVSASELDGSIKVAGYSSIASSQPLARAIFVPPLSQYFANDLYRLLIRAGNFSPTGIVSCRVDIMEQLDYVHANSLVNEYGELSADVFFGGAKKNSLTQEEASELASFVRQGGVLYITGTGGITGDGGVNYNPLFEALDIEDRFTDQAVSYGLSETTIPEKSIITRGPFGVVGPLGNGSARLFTMNHLRGIAAISDTNEYLVFEGRIGKGYLVVTGSWLYSDFLLDRYKNNETYFLNLFALGCDKSWQDNSVVLDVPSLKQGIVPYDNNRPVWEADEYDHGNSNDLWCGSTMAECGCALTSATMVMLHHGVLRLPGHFPVGPRYVNFAAKEPLPNGGESGFYQGNVRWSYFSNLSAFSHIAYEEQSKLEQPVRENYSFGRVKELIDEGVPVILRVNNGSHWVVVKGYDQSSGRLIINDPAKSDPPTGEYMFLDDHYSPDQVGSMIIYRKTNSDYRYLEFATSSKNHILVQDSFGSKSGYDPVGELIVKQIPNSDYAIDPYYAHPEGNGAPQTTEGVYFLTVKLPKDGKYTLHVFSQDGDPHEIAAYSSDIDGALAGSLISPLTPDAKYEFDYNAETAGESVTPRLLLDNLFSVIPNYLVVHGSARTPVAILGSEHFDVSKIQKDSLSLGKTGEEQSLAFCSPAFQDVNNDGIADIVCHFYGFATGLGRGTVEATLTGIYEDGINFKSTGNVSVL